jgi:hypothetical protein
MSEGYRHPRAVRVRPPLAHVFELSSSPDQPPEPIEASSSNDNVRTGEIRGERRAAIGVLVEHAGGDVGAHLETIGGDRCQEAVLALVKSRLYSVQPPSSPSST